jgi:transcriptional regulator with XRE-family HTH domain
VMAAERKITDGELARLRDLHENGWAPSDLAEAFGISARHVGRLLSGEQRPVIAGLDVDTGAASAVDAFLNDVELDAGDEVVAATARALAAKLDACGASDSAAAAQAVPRLAGELVEVLDRLREQVPREPDLIDRLRAKRAARLLANQASNNGRAA